MRYAAFALIVIVIIFAAIVFYTANKSSSIDKQIAAFEAKRRIPDSENAAVIYNKLFENFDSNQFATAFIGFLYNDPNYKSNPWSGKDNPQAAEWLQKQQGIISALLQASKLKNCYFPLLTDSKEVGLERRRSRMTIELVRLLVYAVNNDIGEDRFDEAIEKKRCMLKIAEHIYQQPLWIYYLAGISIDKYFLRCFKKCIMEKSITQQQLQELDGFPVQTKDLWKTKLPQIYQAEKLYEGKIDEKMTFYGKAKESINLLDTQFRLTGQFFDTMEKSIHKLYLRNLADKRACRILIALKRYKDQNGNWPERLGEIKPFIQEQEVLVDPQNNGSFVYKRTENGFTLYSKGPNNKDENGKYDGKADDYMIWP